MKTKEQLELEEILKTKPNTPQCPDEKEYGKCLVWKKETGWYETR